MFFLAAQIELQNQTHKVIKDGFEKVKPILESKEPAKVIHGDVPEQDKDELLGINKNFEAHLPSITLFLEQDSYLNEAMHLDLNFRSVDQDNYKKQKQGKTMSEAINEENGLTFQNSAIHILFYEKMMKKQDQPTIDEVPEVISMSRCKLEKEVTEKFDATAHELDLLLLFKDITAQFVSDEAMEQLLFILDIDIKEVKSPLVYQKILTCFKEFHTASVDNFKAMLDKFNFPYEYDDGKHLTENRRLFKDFFSCLSNIRVAIVEGSHRCEATCRTLHGYQLGDPLPLKHLEITIPETSTIFQPIDIVVYYPKDKNQKLDNDVLKYCKGISEHIADYKVLFIERTRHYFWNELWKDITEHSELQKLLYDKQADFFAENMSYRHRTKQQIKSN